MSNEYIISFTGGVTKEETSYRRVLEGGRVCCTWVVKCRIPNLGGVGILVLNPIEPDREEGISLQWLSRADCISDNGINAHALHDTSCDRTVIPLNTERGVSITEI